MGERAADVIAADGVIVAVRTVEFMVYRGYFLISVTMWNCFFFNCSFRYAYVLEFCAKLDGMGRIRFMYRLWSFRSVSIFFMEEKY